VPTVDVDPVCVVIGRTRHRMMHAEAQEAARRGARFIELRLDLLRHLPDFKRLLADKPCPFMAAIRRKEDGGLWGRPEEARRTLLRHAIAAGFDWVDLETDVIDAIPRFGSVRRVVSYHNFREVPDDLDEIYQRMCRQDADVIKVAVRAQHPVDNVRILRLLQRATHPTVAFCMGDIGLPSRILGGRCGAPFTYAAFNKERTLAPGLPSFDDVVKLYRYRDIDANTQVFGLVGDPVAHSLSPLIHNRSFRQLGINAVYLPFRVARGDLAGYLRALGQVPVRGFSVTIPHKEEAVTLAARCDAASERVGAANTLVRDDEGGLAAWNTDYQAVVETLRANMVSFAGLATSQNPGSTGITTELPPPPAGVLHNKSVLVLGAGGIARAVVYALAREGAAVAVSNRTTERAARLAGDAGCRHVEWANRHNMLADVVVNCTSVGMHPDIDESPLHVSVLKPGMVVFDTVYNPETTLLVKDARSRGCNVITGVELFVRQAALQFKLFTGREAPVQLMRQVARKALSPLNVPEEEEAEYPSTAPSSDKFTPAPSDQITRGPSDQITR
jgi:3-dehydroquinate dehydratase/shikimate dehydrogenase